MPNKTPLLTNTTIGTTDCAASPRAALMRNPGVNSPQVEKSNIPASKRTTNKADKACSNGSSTQTPGSSDSATIQRNAQSQGKTILNKSPSIPVNKRTTPSPNLSEIHSQTTACASIPKKVQPNITIQDALIELIDDTDIYSLFDSAIKCSRLTYILMGFRKSSENHRLYKIPVYDKYCSDHGIILLENEHCTTVSFNVEHNGHVCERIRNFVAGIERDPSISPRVFSPKKVDKFVSSVLHLKNLQILNNIQEIIRRFGHKQIVINLQEVPPSLYVILALNLKCSVTKLINQHLIEIHQKYNTTELDKLGVRKEERNEENISAIEEYIRNLAKKVPVVYDPVEHSGRFEVNGSFMSIVHVPVISAKVSAGNSGINFGIDMNSLPDCEQAYAKIVATSNNLPTNQPNFAKSRPIMTYTQTCNIGSGLLDNGVMLGTFFVICRGIYLEDYKTINFHGHKKSKTSECLLDGIRRGNLDMVFGMFEHDFNSNRDFEVTDKRILVDTRIFEPLLTSFMATLPVVSYNINYVAGDFNMRNDEFSPYGLRDMASEALLFKRSNDLDKIIQLDVNRVIHTPTIHFKNIGRDLVILHEVSASSTSDQYIPINEDSFGPTLKVAAKMVSSKPFDSEQTEKEKKRQKIELIQNHAEELKRREKYIRPRSDEELEAGSQYDGSEVDCDDELDKPYEFRGNRNDRANGRVFHEGAQHDQRQRKG